MDNTHICHARLSLRIAHSTFLRKEQPSVSRVSPPVGWQSITLQLPQRTTVCAWLYTVVICRHPGHLTSMKKLFGDWIIRFSLWRVLSSFGSGFSRSMSMTLWLVLREVPVYRK